MKRLVLFAIFPISLSAFAVDGCKPIHESNPISISVSAKNGGQTIVANNLVVTGNALSPKQPAEQLLFRSGSWFFSLTPIESCPNGVLLGIQGSKGEKQLTVVWNKKTELHGKDGSDYFVDVLVQKAQPK